MEPRGCLHQGDFITKRVPYDHLSLALTFLVIFFFFSSCLKRPAKELIADFTLI